MVTQENGLVLRRHILKYLVVKFHDVYLQFSNGQKSIHVYVYIST